MEAGKCKFGGDCAVGLWRWPPEGGDILSFVPTTCRQGGGRSVDTHHSLGGLIDQLVTLIGLIA